MRQLFRVPSVRRYLLGQSLSILGDTSMWLALAIWVRELTGSNGEAGLTFFFMAAPGLAGPLWGTLIDRYRRRPILVAVNAAAGLMTLSLLAVHNRHQVWVIWLVMTGYGVANSVLSGAQSGFLRTLLPEDLLGDAQGLLTTVREGLRLVSPLIGAGLFTLVGGHPIAILDAATFLVAAASAASIRVHEPTPLRVEQRLRAEVAAGWSHIRGNIRIRQVATSLFATCVVIGFIETGMIAVVTDGLHRSASWLGPVEAMMGVGALVGGPTVAVAMRRFGEGRVSALGMIAFATGAAVMVVPTLGCVAAGAVVAGFGVPWLIAAANTLIQRETPRGLQGRVSTTLDLFVDTPQALSIAAGATLVGVVGYQAMMGAVAVVTMLSGWWLLTRREQRLMAPATPEVEGGELADGTPPFGSLDPQPLMTSSHPDHK